MCINEILQGVRVRVRIEVRGEEELFEEIIALCEGNKISQNGFSNSNTSKFWPWTHNVTYRSSYLNKVSRSRYVYPPIRLSVLICNHAPDSNNGPIPMKFSIELGLG